MKVYNIDKTQELDEAECSMALGYFEEHVETVFHEAVQPQEEIGHYKVIKEYPNGGQDVEWVVDQPKIEAKDAYSEDITYKVYIPYTADELLRRDLKNECKELLKFLSKTDFMVLKYIEGLYTEEQYAPTKAQRESYRERIREIKKQLLPEDITELDI